MTHIGIGITTQNRWGVLAETLAAVRKFGPGDATVVVVDDGSDEARDIPNIPHGVRLIRHDEVLGIPAAKNRCIEELMAAGCTDLFLLDDDTRPACEGWWTEYVNHPEPHLQYCWTHFAGTGAWVPKMHLLYRAGGLLGYAHSMGCMLYVTREVIDRVGGMDLRFGRGMEEHIEFSQRIHNAGFTTFAHQDVEGSEKLIYASDEHGTVVRSMARRDRQDLLARNVKLRESLADSDRYVEYRRQRDIVLTTYLTALPDDQRNRHWAQTTKPIEPLADSVGHDRLVLLHDLLAPEVPYETHRVDPYLSPYLQRWLGYYQYLRIHPEVNRVWCVDATDVTMVRDPFPHMVPGVLYTGDEPQQVSCPWVRRHATRTTKCWMSGHKRDVLLNAGVVGGDRADIMRLARRVLDLAALDRFEQPLAEMLYFNIAAREHPSVQHGPHITNEFKSYRDNGTAWWLHK